MPSRPNFRLPNAPATLALAALLLTGTSRFSPPASATESSSTPNLQETLEFQFSGLPSNTWRTSRPAGRLAALANALGDPESTTATGEIPLLNPAGTRTLSATDRVAVGFPADHPFPPETATRLGLRLDRTLQPGLVVLQAADSWTAAQAADALARLPGITLATPVLRRHAALQGPFAPRPNDPYFTEQWHLENRDSGGQRIGPDTHPRGAWAITRGEGVTLAVYDNGFETTHPDLAGNATGQAHFDFTRNRAGAPVYGAHATCVAGLAGATGGNRIGVSGLAPAAALLSAPIFDSTGNITTDERLFNAYTYLNDTVPIQNHSWANSDVSLASPGPLEGAGLSNAVTHGRNGLGTIVVRAAGNYRQDFYNANYDGSANDPGVITVAAVRQDGRAASYSNPGTCILVGAPSGDDENPFKPSANLVTTDLPGSRGYNTSGTGDRANYVFGASGFWGTSAATPQISGIVALILSANPTLARRDVQQVLLHAARHHDPTDPSLHRNGAGYAVSDNQGFGVPDAGQAVALARSWSNRPPLTTLRFATNRLLQIPNDGLRVLATGTDGIERSIACAPAMGRHADDPTDDLPLVFVGRANTPLTNALAGRAALIERGDRFFHEKIERAADAGAAFAIIYNHLNGDEIFVPEGTDFARIPAVMISQNEGRTLVDRLTAGEPVRARIRLDTARQTFAITNTLVCEHVGLRVRASHDRRGDLRITLTSPAGTRSVLQSLNEDPEAGPSNWTYWSVHHFYEPSAGTWTVHVSDEAASVRGAIIGLDLILHGTPISDTDADGLDDGWETRAFGSLAAGPAEDPDADGHSNAREQALHLDPVQADPVRRLDLTSYDDRQLLRLSWPGTDGAAYRLLRNASAGDPPTEVARIPGTFPETEWIVPFDIGTNQLFWIETPAVPGAQP